MLNDDSLAEPLTSSPSPSPSVEEEEESPLKEKKMEVNVNPKKTHSGGLDGDAAKRFTTKEKGKSRAVVGSAVQVSLSKSRTVEKENQVKMKSVRGSSGSSSSSGGFGSGSSGLVKMKAAIDGKKAIKPTSAAAATASLGTTTTTRVGMKLPPGKGGARRVPIDSAEAAPVGPGWRK
jgi:hypothetical protein